MKCVFGLLLFFPPLGRYLRLLKVKGKKDIEHSKTYFSLCLQKNFTLSSPTDVKVRAPFSRPELRSQTPRTSVDVTICPVVFTPPAVGLPLRRPGALHGAAGISAQNLHQHKAHLVQSRRAGELPCSAIGESRRRWVSP